MEKILCWHRKTCTHRLHRFFYRPTFLHAETVAIAVFTQQKLFSTEAFTHQKKMQSSSYRQTVFLHRKFSAQKSYAQKVLRTTFFTYRRFYVLIDTNCRQKLVHTARVYTANFYTERLRFPFLITYFLDTECFSFWKPWFGIFWTCPALPGLSQTLWNCARHWDDGKGWPIMEHILKICFTVHTSYTSITCVHVQYKDAYLCACDTYLDI